MQREIKNRTLTYGIAAVLLACILTATVYNFGIQPYVHEESDIPPELEPPTDAPSDPSDPNVPPETDSPPETDAPPETDSPPETDAPPSPDSPPELSELKTFSSYEELQTFLTAGMDEAAQSENLNRFTVDFGAFSTQDSAPPTSAETFGGSEYSTTNVQVAGVDEADIVKNDGEYLYIISGSDIYILKAYPPNQAEVLSKIELNETYDAQLYLNENKLVVLGSRSPFLQYGFAEIRTEGLWINPSVYNEEIFLRVYDITNRADPVLSRTVTMNGTLSGSRMIGDYVYAVVRQLATQPSSNGTGVEAVLPIISGNHTQEVLATEIRYIDTPDVFYYMTTIVAVDVMDDTEEPTYEPFLTGYTTTMYVSLNNMYLVVPNTTVWILGGNGEEPREETMIFRIKLDQEKIVAMAEGNVTGNVLNQFSMDEHNGFFRIATTTNEWWGDGVSKNHLFIMNMSLNIVGKLEDLAPGETIYSTRFMGDRGYIVTFRKIDPLFVIDLTEPTDPTVLGQLEVTGYSDYLHPYDENHLIGIGKETEASEEGDFAWYQGVKISLFDVSDVSNPVEVVKYEIGDRGTDSPILYDHKALLFDKNRNLLVIPVSVAEINQSDYPEGVPDWAHGQIVWQGAYVFDISPDGIELRGGITHLDEDLLENGYWFYSEYSVERSLYIDDVLYTVSDKLVKMNDLESLDSHNEIELS
ncbi:MAG: beta-propeller domain-containing protein [Candidatus Bathyarchaeum sp.]|nr:MAG: beta-propeller domain-containing protein [Candidatus Bathyarchaeum sp.]